MERDTLYTHLRSQRGITEEYPFGPQPLVCKVGGKMFALLAEDADPLKISLKCDPDRALELRAIYPAITAGYHLDKRHWNTLVLDGTILDDEVLELIDHSYALIFASLPKRVREELMETNFQS